MRRPLVLVLVPIVLTLGGCLAVRAPDLSAPSPGPVQTPVVEGEPIDWPARWGDETGAGKGALIDIEDGFDWRPLRYGPNHEGRPKPRDLERVRRLAVGRIGPAGYRFQMEGPGGYVWVPDAERALASGKPPDRSAHRRTDALERNTLVFVSGRRTRASSEQPHIQIERTWMQTLMPRGDTPRGVVVLIPGLYGTPRFLFRGIAECMAEDGWAVLRLLSPPSRFMERHEIPLLPSSAEASARAAADWFDNRFAETAYAVEAGLRDLEDRYPAAAGGPLALVGISGGALATPAVAARLTEVGDGPPDAAVMVAGAEHALEMTARSAYTSWIDAVRFRWPDQREGEVLPPDEFVDAFREPYMKATELDPGRVAWALEDSEVLLVHGRRDTAVPAYLGDRLWLRLGRPERWEAPAGHLELVFRLWMSKDRLVHWLDRTLPRAHDEPAESAGAETRDAPADGEPA